MSNLTVVQLKSIEKERGIRGYYKLRKAELIHVLEATRLVEQTNNIFDGSIPNDPIPVLQPTPWRPSNVTTKVKQNKKKFFTTGMQKIQDFGELLLSCIPPPPKVVGNVLEPFKNKIIKIYEKRDTLFQQIQSKSALKNFAIQHRIKGPVGYDPEPFMLNSKQLITILMINARQTKVKLVLW